MYFVIFDASVVKANGMIGDKVVYKYDYTVSMKNKIQLMIDEIKLNEFYQKKDTKQSEKKDERKKKKGRRYY